MVMEKVDVQTHSGLKKVYEVGFIIHCQTCISVYTSRSTEDNFSKSFYILLWEKYLKRIKLFVLRKNTFIQ